MAQYEIIRPRRDTWLDWFKRSITLGPWNPRDKAIARYFGSSPVSSGVSVNEETAMNYSAVWGAVTLLSGSVSILPLEFYKRDGDAKTKYRNHPLYRLLHDRANPLMGSALFRRTMIHNKLVWGNAYAEIERDAVGRPIALWPLLPWQMTPSLENGVLRYCYSQPTGQPIDFATSDIIHLRGPSDDGICGMSAIRHGRESMGLGIAAERFGATFFGNGSTFGGILSYPVGVAPSQQVRDENRAALEKMHQGPDKAHRFLAIYEGAKYERTGIPPDDAQFLQTRLFQVEEVCRWFNIPPHKLKDLEHATYSNIEQLSIEYLTDSLEPHLTDYEEEHTIKLISPLEQLIQLIEFNREGFLRGDAASRSELQSKQFSIGAATTNEIRALENRNPIAGGNVAFVPLNLIPIDLARPYWEAQIEAKKAPPQAPQPVPNNQPAPNTDGEMKALREQLELARSLTQKAEDLQAKAEADAEQERQAHAKTIETLTVANDALEQANRLRREAEDREASITSEVVALKSEREQMIGERDQAKAEILAEREAHAATRAGAAAFAEASELSARQVEMQRAAERESASKEISKITVQRDAERQLRVDAVALVGAQLDAMTVDRDTWKVLAEQESEKHSATIAIRDALQAERDSAKIRLGETENDLNVAKLKIATLEGDISRLESGATAQREQLADLTQREKDATQQSEVLAADIEALKTDLARARADIAAELDKQRNQKAALLAAMRSLFVDATERLLQKEADRARKHQATAEKLRAHVENFYPLHAENVRAAFQPIVGPWTAITGGAPGLLLDRLVSEHVEGSRRALELALEAGDSDELAANLARTLNRWETERADAMADALVREGMGDRG